MIAIKVNTTNYRTVASLEELLPDEVQFSGDYRFDPSGNSLMIWDAALGNIREALPAEITAKILDAVNNGAKGMASADDSTSKALKAVMLVLLDAHNRQSRQFRELLAAVAGATNLADLKTRVAAISPVEPDRSVAEVKAAIASKIDAGLADG